MKSFINGQTNSGVQTFQPVNGSVGYDLIDQLQFFLAPANMGMGCDIIPELENFFIIEFESVNVLELELIPSILGKIMDDVLTF